MFRIQRIGGRGDAIAGRVALIAGLLTVALCRAAEASDMSLADAVSAPTRTPSLVSRDRARHPLEELRFLGVTPRSSVIEIWPGGGYWTEILAPYLRPHGRYTLADDVATGEPDGKNFAMDAVTRDRLRANPRLYGRVRWSSFGATHLILGSDQSADLVLTFRNLHNWIGEGDALIFLQSINHALKTGGILGIEDHRARTDRAQDPKAADGYVRQDFVIDLARQAGFELVGSSEILANPRDTTHWPKGVWTLPPTFALGSTDRAAYEAIGEADNFLLKFRKIRQTD